MVLIDGITWLIYGWGARLGPGAAARGRGVGADASASLPAQFFLNQEEGFGSMVCGIPDSFYFIMFHGSMYLHRIYKAVMNRNH